MKHTTTHKMLDMVLAVALAVLAGGSFISIRAQAAVSALPQRATLSRAPRLPYDLKWPSSWETVFASDLRGALDTSINRLERGPGTVRRALLLLTNRADELPPDTFEQTDARLAHSAAMVYLMAVKPPRFKATHRKVIVR